LPAASEGPVQPVNASQWKGYVFSLFLTAISPHCHCARNWICSESGVNVWYICILMQTHKCQMHYYLHIYPYTTVCPKPFARPHVIKF